MYVYKEKGKVIQQRQTLVKQFSSQILECKLLSEKKDPLGSHPISDLKLVSNIVIHI